MHDNPGAGISLDLAFDHNTISNAVLVANDLGIFMRASRDNQFYNITIHDSRHFGVFMAQRSSQTMRLAAGAADRMRGQCLHESDRRQLRRRGFPRQQHHLHE